MMAEARSGGECLFEMIKGPDALSNIEDAMKKAGMKRRLHDDGDGATGRISLP